jgi:hypothetical protein
MRRSLSYFGIAAAMTLAFVAGSLTGSEPVEAAKTIMASTPVMLVPDEGPFRSLALVHVNATAPESFPGWVEVRLFDENGVHRATPIRFKMTNSAQRIAADFPGCDANYVITNSSGQITNG